MSTTGDQHKARDTIIDHIMSKENFYDILNVPNDATDSDIKKAYRALALLLHPDKTPESESQRASEAFKAVNEAHTVLSDSEMRAEYDKEQTALRLERERQERERKERERHERARQEQDRKRKLQQEELARAKSLQTDSGLSRSEFWVLVGAAIGFAGLAALCYFSTSRDSAGLRCSASSLGVPLSNLAHRSNSGGSTQEQGRSRTNNSSKNKSKRNPSDAS